MRKHLWLLFAALIPYSIGWILWHGVPVRVLLDPWVVLIASCTAVLMYWSERANRKRKDT